MTDTNDSLIAEYQKEKEIASGGNPSEYHKKRFESLKKELAGNVIPPEKVITEPETIVQSTASDTSSSNTS